MEDINKDNQILRLRVTDNVNNLFDKELEIVDKFVHLLRTGELDPRVVSARLDYISWHYPDLIMSDEHYESDKMDGARLFTLAQLKGIFRNEYLPNSTI